MALLPKPLDDPARLAALKELNLLDTPAEPSFDRLAQLVRRFLDVPVSLVSLVDDQRQFFKAACGLSGWVDEARETKLTHSFCQHVVTSGRYLIVGDARHHPLLKTNLAVHDLGVVAYLGFPVSTPDGFILGSFCAIDTKPRAWTDSEIDLMADLTELVSTEIALRWHHVANSRALRASACELFKTSQLQQAVLDGTDYSIIGTAVDGTIQIFNAGAEKMLGYHRAEMVERQTPAIIHVAAEIEERAAEMTVELGRHIEPGLEVFMNRARAGMPEEREWTYVRKDGTRLTVILNTTALRSSQGELTGFLGIARTVSAEKMAERLAMSA